MVFKIQKILEKGKFNWKGLNKILHEHEERLDALEGGESPSNSTLGERISNLESYFTRDLTFTINDGSDPIQGATVSIASLSKTGTTGSSGGCTISGVMDGTYEVTVSKTGYTTSKGNKTVSSDSTSFTISLEAELSG